ncbi:MAG: heat-inducible transcriptional repressor HrcA [Dehalococcoidia bacterium]
MQRTPTLNLRRQNILEFIVGDYIQTAAPVASQQIAKRHHLQVSPATIRNDMAELEEMGFISRPHTSAGGVPGDMAYRFYVEHAATRARPSRQFEDLVQGAIDADAGDPEEWARHAAWVLSKAVQNVAIATTPRVSNARVKQLQLVHLHEGQALLVVVTQEAKLRQHMVQFPKPVTQEALSELAAHLNVALSGKTAGAIKTAWDAGELRGDLAQPVVTGVLGLIAEEERAAPQRPYREGLRELLSQPEFQTGYSARAAVAVVEDDEALGRIISEAASDQDVDVIIGRENRHEPLRPYSVVLAHYGPPGEAMGVIAAVGPTRMDYVGAIANVRYLAEFLSGLVGALDAQS